MFSIKAMEEFREIQRNPINLPIEYKILNGNNIFRWRVTAYGPPDTLYAGGKYYIFIKFPQNYPESPPKVYFETPIYHINVNRRSVYGDEVGTPNLNILNRWKPEYKIRDVIISIYSLFYMNNTHCSHNSDMVDEFLNNKATYERKARFYTEKFAYNPRRLFPNWDFTEQ